jgi:AraC-like DNA-binding protein
VIFQSYIPQPPLANFVEMLWYFQGYEGASSRERVLPTGDAQLVISLDDAPLRAYEGDDGQQLQSYRGPLLCGPRSKCSIIDTAPLGSSMGVQFKPGGVFPFLGASAGELHNQNVPLESLWGKEAADVRDRLLEAKSPRARFQILEQALLARTFPVLERHPAVSYALKAFQAVPHGQTIGEVTERTGLSSRWLIELFRAQVGLTPKLYCRLRRFQTAVSLISSQQGSDLAGLAHTCGYFDQAHFNREFRDFAGISPTKYLADKCEHQNHVRVAG